MLLATLAVAWYFYDSARWFSADTQELARASSILSEHETIARHTWQALQDMEQAVRLERPVEAPGGAAAAASVNGALARLRTLIEAAPDAEAGSGSDELLTELEAATEDVFRAILLVETALADGQGDLAGQALARLDTSGAVSRFRAVIDSALEQRRADLDDLGEAAVSLADYVLRLLPLIMLLLVLGTAFVAGRFSRRLSRSLGALHEAAQEFAAGKLQHRVPRLDEQEFERLGNAFNEMASELDEKERQLRESNVSLEAKVEERTRALKESAEQLAMVDEHRRKLLAEISHEFRTPLTVIRGESEIALRGKSNTKADYQEAFRRIIDTADHATGLVEDLLFIVRADAGEPRLQLQSVELVELVGGVCEEFGAKAAGKELEIRFHDSVERATLQGDPRRLRQVFAILLDNALRYSLAGGVVDVAADELDGRLVVAVTDQGIGLSEDEASHAFERFFRGRQAQSHAEQGTGLGLPVAKAIVEAHGGTIDLRPGDGQGAVATVVLPVEGSLRVVA